MSKNWLLTRRRALRLGLATLAALGASAKGKSITWHQQAQAIEDSEKGFMVVGEASLKERALAKGLIYGAAARGVNELWDKEFVASFIQECSMIVPKGEFRWNALNPSPNRFNFKPYLSIRSESFSRILSVNWFFVQYS